MLDARQLHLIDAVKIAMFVEHTQSFEPTLLWRSDQPVLHRLTGVLDWNDVRIKVVP